jgi:hypothetical protein
MKVVSRKTRSILPSVVLVLEFANHTHADMMVTACDSTIQLRGGQIVIGPEAEQNRDYP